MSEKAFTMTSNQYCGSCGSFDLVKEYSSWTKSLLWDATPALYCHGCDNRLCEKDFANNAIRTLPLMVHDFFYQTNIRNQQLQKKQIQPFTKVLGFSLIACAITSLFLVKSPGHFEGDKVLQIEWASPSKDIGVHGIDVVQVLQLEINKLVKAK